MSRLLLLTIACLVLNSSFLTAQTDPDPSSADLSKAETQKLEQHKEKADQAVKADKFKRALRKYEKVLEIDPMHKHALIGVAYSSYVLGQNHDREKKQKQYFDLSLAHAEKAYKMSTMSVDANLMMAMIYDKQMEFVPPAEQLKLAQSVERYTRYVQRFEQRNAKAYYLMGRAYHVMATLPFEVQDKAKDMLPAHMYRKKAIEQLEKAVKLESQRLLYHYTLAQVYEEDLRSKEALEAVNEALKLEPTLEDGGENILMRCRELKFTLD